MYIIIHITYHAESAEATLRAMTIGMPSVKELCFSWNLPAVDMEVWMRGESVCLSRCVCMYVYIHIGIYGVGDTHRGCIYVSM